MLAGFWFPRMPVCDSLRAISPGGVPILFLLPGPLALVPVPFAVGIALFAFAHGQALAQAILPAFGVMGVLEVAWNVLPELWR